MYKDIIVSPTSDNRYIVQKDIVYKDIVVPKGYKTNGADIPRVFWSIIPPFKPKYLPAVIVHDYLCDTEDYAIADKYFEEVLINIENSVITNTMITVVKFYHKLGYGK